MTHQVPVSNPFMLMLHPEVVIAAVENSERLNRLNRHLCRPLDRPTPAPAAGLAPGFDDEPDVADPLA